MTRHLIPYDRISLWSHTDLAYIQQDPVLRDFYAVPPTAEGIAQALARRSAAPVDRELFLQVLRDQYAAMGLPLPADAGYLTDDRTFTVTTAHQPSLLTGPLYNIFKIASTIRLSRTLTDNHPGHRFLPVFVVGGEDHDWAEINHLHIYGKKHVWEREAAGPCGRLSTEGLAAFIEEILALLERNPHTDKARELLGQSLDGAGSYGTFHQKLIASLFGSHGLIVLNMDDARLKAAFRPVMEQEITEAFSARHVPPVQAKLEALGFKPQAYCRPLNLFYMEDGVRERLEPDGDDFIRVESGIRYTRAELLNLLQSSPESFSPNVILRPLYQELILPNVAFVGGGGEIAYWLERKAQFEAVGIPFPALIRRNSALLLDEATQQQLEKIDLTWSDVLDDYDTIVRHYVLAHSATDLTYDAELETLSSAYAALAAKADSIDPTLAKAILADQHKHVKAFEQLGSRLLRAEKHHQEVHLKRIQKIKDRLFPEGGLQERHENFLPFYTQYGPAWIDDIIDQCDPLDGRFMVLELP